MSYRETIWVSSTAVDVSLELLRRQDLPFGHMSNQPANCPDTFEGWDRRKPGH